MELTTERLRLRPVEDDDAHFLYQLHRNPDLLRFIPSAALADLAAARESVPRWRSLLGDPVLGRWLVTRHDGIPVGLVMFKPIPASQGVERDDVEIGWRQEESACGHGYMTEAAAAVLQHAAAHGVRRVVAVTHPDNIRSQNVCRRLGMRHLGATDDYYDTRTELFEWLAPAAAPAEGGAVAP